MSVSHRVPITIRVEHFEGPLDLLLYLIQGHELDISKVSISKITDQYLQYVRLMQELNFDVASDFLVMAATLIHWKSKAILPQEVDPNAVNASDEDGVLTPEQLLRQLLEHQRFLKAGEDLAALNLLGADVFTRPNTKPPTERVWREMSITDLSLTYQDVIAKSRKRKTILKKETVSLVDKIGTFASRLKMGERVLISALIDDFKFRPEVVVTFLASLELARLKKLKVYQEGGAYTDIFLELLESLKNFDTTLASGFDSIESAVESTIPHPSAVAEPVATETESVFEAAPERAPEQELVSP